MEFADWTRAFVMMGDSPVGVREVLLAEDGSMYALLQGETALGALQTVRLDSEGRMSAFVIDSIDAWTRMLTIGNAELAVRLGSPVVYDRRGQVLFMETFEQGMYKWTTAVDGDLAAVELSPVAALSGGYGVKLTGGSDASNLAEVSQRVPARPVGRMGIEASLSMPAGWDYVRIDLYLYTGARVLYGAFRWNYEDYELVVYDPVEGQVVVGTGEALGADAREFNTIKLVLNIDTEEYVRLMFNQQEIPLGDYEIFSVADPATPPSVKVVIGLYGREDENDTMYLDNVILTGAEPE